MRRLYRWLILGFPGWLLAQGLTVALMLPMKGELAPVGREFLQGFRMGLRGDVTARVWDTRGDPRRALRFWQSLGVQPRVRLVVGPLTSEEMAAVLQASPVPQVAVYSPLALDPAQCSAVQPVFGPFAGVCAETRKLAEVLKALRVQNLLVLSPRSPRPLARYRALQRLLQGQDFQKVSFALYPEDTLSLSWLQGILDTVNTEGLVLCAAGPTGVGLADYARGIGFHGKVFAFGEWLAPTNREMARFTDSVFVVTLDRDLARDRSVSVDLQAFRHAYADSTGTVPGTVALQGYLAGVLVSRMAERGEDPAAFFQAYPVVPVFEGFQLLLPVPGFIKLVLLRKGTVKEVALQ